MKLRLLTLLSFCFVVFQNCAPFESAELFQVYSYSERPDFFYDLKLLRIEEDELLRQRFLFDVAATLAEAPAAPVHYRLSFSTLMIPAVCQTQEGIATGAAKHFRVSCLMPLPDDLYVQLELEGPQGQRQAEEYRFSSF